MKDVLIIFIWTIAVSSFGQQVTDLDFNINIQKPKYGNDQTAIIGIDNTHNNLHTLNGGFAPFAKLMRADGYQLESVTLITEDNLESLNILVIANPIHPTNIGNWKRPIEAAFDQYEIEVLENWVSKGGSLLVIADHMPYAGATDILAQKFGFSYEDGFVMSENQLWPPDSYSKKAGNLYTTEITADIDSLAGFTGSALIAPKDAVVIATFPSTHKLLIPEVAWQFDKNTQSKEVDGYVLGALKKHGKGKVAFFTEAAMFTAQIVQERFKVGLNAPEAPQNQKFTLNLIHWLDSGKAIQREKKVNETKTIVDNLLKKQGKAYEANNLNGVANFYTNDGIIYEPTGNELRGIKSINDYWETLNGKAVSWNYEILEVEKIGEQILAVCRFDISFKQTEENIVTARSKAILTFKKENGNYKLFRDFYMPIRQ